MTRVATFHQSQNLMAQLMRAQSTVFNDQKQVSSGKVAQTFQDIPREAGVLLSAKAVETKTQSYIRAGQELETRLSLQNTHLEGVATVAQDLRESVLQAVANEKGIGLMDALDAAFTTVKNILNTQVDGRYYYAGTRTDVAPVNATDVSDLVAATSASDLFENNDIKPSLLVDDNLSVEYGILASDVATDLFDAIKRIADYNAGANGPFGTELTAAQRQFLEGEVAGLAQVAEGLNAEVASNGLSGQILDRALERHAATEVQVKGFISDIEDVDLAEAITRLNADQTAVEAATRVLGTLNQLSLMDFLR